MKKVLSIIVFTVAFSLAGFSQDIILGKFLGSINPDKFQGNSRYKLYEKQVEIIEVNSAGQNKGTTISFKFNPCAASADFMAHAQAGTAIAKALVTVLTKPDSKVGINHIKYQVYMEDAIVVSSTDTQACNGTMATTVVLKPQRICWIYQNYDISNKPLPATTNGFDTKTGRPWTVTPPNF